MVHSQEEKELRKKEIAAMKELKSYMWSYRKISLSESTNLYSILFFIKYSSHHPCCGPVINPVEEEECKRFSFGGFNPRVDVSYLMFTYPAAVNEGTQRSSLHGV